MATWGVMSATSAALHTVEGSVTVKGQGSLRVLHLKGIASKNVGR